MNDKIEIPLNKKKTFLLFIGAVAFVGLSSWMIIHPQSFLKSNAIGFVKMVGYIGAAFFGFCGIAILQKLLNTKPAIVLDSEGLVDNTTALHAGKIKWSEITEVFQHDVMGNPFIMIGVKSPEQYIDRQLNPIKKRLMELNQRMYNTPIQINTRVVKMNADELFSLILEKYRQYKK